MSTWTLLVYIFVVRHDEIDEMCRSGRWHALDYQPNNTFFSFSQRCQNNNSFQFAKNPFSYSDLTSFTFYTEFLGNESSKGVGYNEFK